MNELISQNYVLKLNEALDYLVSGDTSKLSKENLAQLIVNGLLDESYAIYINKE